MKILLAGATGLIGHEVLRLLRDAGHVVSKDELASGRLSSAVESLLAGAA